jgi:hypothetical protein
MKIVQINSVCGIGSTGRITTDIHEGLLKMNTIPMLFTEEIRLAIATMHFESEIMVAQCSI